MVGLTAEQDQSCPSQERLRHLFDILGLPRYLSAASFSNHSQRKTEDLITSQETEVTSEQEIVSL
jgi:hypothetical protein